MIILISLFITLFQGCQRMPLAKEAILKLTINEELFYYAKGTFLAISKEESRIETSVTQHANFREQKTIYFIDRIIQANKHTRHIDTNYQEESGHYILQKFYDYDEDLGDYIFAYDRYEFISKERLDDMSHSLPPVLPIFKPSFDEIDLSTLKMILKRHIDGYVIQILTDVKTLEMIEPEFKYFFLDDDIEFRYNVIFDKDFQITDIQVYANESFSNESSTWENFSIEISFENLAYNFPLETQLSEHRRLAGYPDA
jgi:hypothetical protein